MRFRLYPPQKIIDGGNHTTAARWVKILQSLGHDAVVSDFQIESIEPNHICIFFNAAKSAARILEVCQQHGSLPIIVVLSGTDLQPERLDLPQTQAAMEAATLLVVYEKSAMTKLSSEQLTKSVIVPHSMLAIDLPEFEFASSLNFVSVSHIRSEKNLTAYFRCVDNLELNGVSFHHIGGSIDEQLAQKVKAIAADAKVILHGRLPYKQTVAMIQAADLLVHPSIVEGFPNVIVEAFVHGTPVAMSRIPAHSETFQNCLPSALFFDTDCGFELQNLLTKFAESAEFRNEMKQVCTAIADQFNPQLEQKALMKLLHRIA